MTYREQVELLAPAGTYEALHAAIRGGCDAVYFGLDGFNMRAHVASPFTLDDLAKIAEICREAKVKCYLALNTLVYDDHVEDMKRAIDAVKAHGVNAVIAFDPSVIAYARAQGVEVHLSTQHSVSNIEAVKFFSTFVDRIVLARELTLEQIRFITEQIGVQDVRGPSGRLVEIEVFIHGAMCVAVSGRCGMSLYLYNTSANCGTCSQPCRRAFTVTDPSTGKQLDIDNEYVMSTQDLCTIGLFDELLASGVVSLKIEGRGRAPEYVDEVVRCYREAIDAVDQQAYTQERIQAWNERLGTVFNRGMSDGFYRGKAFSYWSGQSDSKATQKKEFVGIVEHVYSNRSVAEIRLQAGDLAEGQDCLVTGPTTGVVRFTAKDMRVDDQPVQSAHQGDCVTCVVTDQVRKNDKVYKLISV